MQMFRRTDKRTGPFKTTKPWQEESLSFVPALNINRACRVGTEAQKNLTQREEDTTLSGDGGNVPAVNRRYGNIAAAAVIAATVIAAAVIVCLLIILAVHLYRRKVGKSQSVV
ncbi:hypothetical protein LDENG_00234290 [Lucifuga dentata]|nr:hypothetical protein LDENG_00234290 [Lucifuga dentata]